MKKVNGASCVQSFVPEEFEVIFFGTLQAA
jgi:hypothetical protein